MRCLESVAVRDRSPTLHHAVHIMLIGSIGWIDWIGWIALNPRVR